MILAELNILLMVLLGCSTVKKYKRKNFNLESVSRSGDKSGIINSLGKWQGGLVAWAEH